MNAMSKKLIIIFLSVFVWTLAGCRSYQNFKQGNADKMGPKAMTAESGLSPSNGNIQSPAMEENTEIDNEYSGNAEINQLVGSRAITITLKDELFPDKLHEYYTETYGDFVKKLNLSDKKGEELIRLIALLDRGALDGFEETRSGPMEGTGKRIVEIRTEREKELQDFLGEKDYLVFKEYQEVLPERSTIIGYEELLGPDKQLDDKKKEKMIQAMHSARKQFESNPGSTDRNPPDGISKLVYENSLLYKLYLSSVKDILSETEFAKFEEYFKQMNVNNESLSSLF
jgi:hypothetical protein